MPQTRGLRRLRDENTLIRKARGGPAVDQPMLRGEAI
jgi:hypothetical protein